MAFIELDRPAFRARLIARGSIIDRIGGLLATAVTVMQATTVPGRLAYQFFLQAALAVVLLAILVPPFENPDEFNHVNRVDQISTGGLVSTRYDGPHTSGGVVDTAIDRIDQVIGTIRFHPERKVTRDMMLYANAVRWGDRLPTTFANTSIYSPFLYGAAVVGLWAGKFLGLSVTRTLIVSRAVNGLACVLAGSVAIAIAGEAALFLFIVLSLPMSLFLFASVSQDGPILVLAALAVGLISVLQKHAGSAGPLPLIALSGCLALIGIGRPAYAPFCILPLLLSRIALRSRMIATAASLAGVGGWSLIAAHWALINAVAFRGVDPKAQAEALATHPWLWWRLAVSIVTGPQGMEKSSFYREMVGILGWLDVFLPDPFYTLAGVALFVSFVAILVRDRPLLSPPAQGVAFGAAAGSVILIFLLEYVSWTPVGFPIVEGVQGRYFLPIILFLPAMLPHVPCRHFARVVHPCQAALLAFPMVSISVMIGSVVHRYYL